jgi:hypothetical protein
MRMKTSEKHQMQKFEPKLSSSYAQTKIEVVIESL